MRRRVLLLSLVAASAFLWWSLPVPRPAPSPAQEPGPDQTDASPATPDPAAVITDGETASAPESPNGAIVVHVLGPDGEPVPRAFGLLWRFPGRHGIRERFEVREGRGAHVPGSPLPSSVRIEVYGAEGCGPYLTELLGPEGQTVEISLPEPVEIRGVVVDQHGTPVSGVRIEARAAYAEFRNPLVHNNRPHGAALSGEDGTFRLDGLGDRDYHLRTFAKEGFEAADPAGTVRGGTGEHRLVCWRLETVALRVVGPDGRPVVGADVGLLGRRFKQSRETDAQGWARFADYDSRWIREVEIRPPDDREDVLAWTRRGGLPESPTIELAPALPLAGTVRDTDGQPVPEGQISWRRAGTADEWRWQIADTDGCFRIPRVPVGKIEIRATVPDYEVQPEPDETRTVNAGRTDLSFVVRKTPTVALKFEDWAAGETGTGYLHVEGRERYGRWGRGVGESGVVRFAGLKSGDVVSVFVRTSLGRAWVGHGFRPDGKIRVVRGLRHSRITGQLLGMTKGARLRVEVCVLWDLELRGEPAADGRFEIAGIPPGRWKIRVDPTHAGVDLWGRADATAGEHVEIRLGNRRPDR